MLLFNKDKFGAIYKTASIDDLKSLLLVNSYEQYKAQDGRLTKYQLYYTIKDRAKGREINYISLCDKKFSGISGIGNDALAFERALSQIMYILLSTIFDEPLRTVSYSSFDLDEFNKL